LKILFVTTVSETANTFLIPHIRMLLNQGHSVDVAFSINQDVSPEFSQFGCKIYNLSFRRSPFSFANYKAYLRIKKLLVSEKYELVHTHTPIASAFVRLACIRLKSIIVIYTSHGFHFYKGSSLASWIFYYPIERFLANFTDLLITINSEDYIRAKNSFHAKYVEYIPGIGIDLVKFKIGKIDKSGFRKEIGISNDDFLMLSVGELNNNKNHEIVLRALSGTRNKNIFYVICGLGKKYDYLIELAKSLGISNQVKLIGYRKDIKDIYQSSDLFVFPSIREGLSVSLMEAMASGLPVICSNIRGNNDLIDDFMGGFLINKKSIKDYSNSIIRLFLDKGLRNQMGTYNFIKVNRFDLEIVKTKMNQLYQMINVK